MKIKTFLTGLLFLSISCFSQNRAIDSLHAAFNHTAIDTGENGKIKILCNLANQFIYSAPDSAFLFSQQAYKIATKKNDVNGLSDASVIIGTVYLNAGNYPKALEYYLQKLKIDEKRQDKKVLATSLIAISGLYGAQGDYNKAFKYAFLADSFINKTNNHYLKLYNQNNLGYFFEKTGNITKALFYNNETYRMALKENNLYFVASALINLGNAYSKANNNSLAIQNYLNAIPVIDSLKNNSFLAEASIGLAKQYMFTKQPDSAQYYGLLAYNTSKMDGLLNFELDASIFLKEYFKSIKDIENAFTYQENVLTLKDSIFSKERLNKSQVLSMEEDLRQKEIEEKKIEEEHERQIKLQYLVIALSLPIFLFVTVYLSNRKIKARYIEFLGIVSLLLAFEFIMLLLHPLIVSLTNHMPIYQLLIFAVIASILTPIHHRIEQWLIKILTKQEKVSLMKIRIQ